MRQKSKRETGFHTHGPAWKTAELKLRNKTNTLSEEAAVIYIITGTLGFLCVCFILCCPWSPSFSLMHRVWVKTKERHNTSPPPPKKITSLVQSRSESSNKCQSYKARQKLGSFFTFSYLKVQYLAVISVPAEPPHCRFNNTRGFLSAAGVTD